tara:strand:- start:4002 stop:4712 length:711 start_codon:yes stop_codon:yes gene_type:complete
MNLSSHSTVSIVVAKANSSRVPRKNFRTFFNGSSLVDLTLDLHCNSGLDIPIILSTDEVSYVVPSNVFLHSRSPSLSQFETPVIDVLLDVIKAFHLSNNCRLILLQPTSPFRTPKNYIDFVSFMNSHSSKSSAFSVYRVEDNHPARMYYLDSDKLTPVLAEKVSLQSQDLNDCYHRNGCFYSLNVPDILEGNLYSNTNPLPFIMPFESSVNIDTILDFKIAQTLYPQFIDGSLAKL